MCRYKRFIKPWFMALLMVLLGVVLFGCGGSGSSDSQPGTLGVSLTDASTSGFDAVNVTVSKVRVHQSAIASENDPGWSEITLDPARKINLLRLTNGVLQSLGQTPLPAGHYTQLRLVLSMNTVTTIANSVVTSGTTTEIPLITPSAVQSGIKLIHEFDVAPGQQVDVTLDFDALKSIVRRGNGSYALMPVIQVVPTVLTGIEGFVDPSVLNDNVMVSSQVSGTVVRSTVPDPQTGEFLIDHLAAGSYDLVITADGHATGVIAGVPVSTATSTAVVTMVSTSASPISLPTSTMRKIGGTVALLKSSSTPTVAYVDAKQIFKGGPIVTVKSQTVDLLSGGTVSLSLPVAAPQLGLYGTGTLPITLTSQPAFIGKYTAEASASGYQTQSFSVDISTSDAILKFLLTPLTP